LFYYTKETRKLLVFRVWSNILLPNILIFMAALVASYVLGASLLVKICNRVASKILGEKNQPWVDNFKCSLQVEQLNIFVVMWHKIIWLLCIEMQGEYPWKLTMPVNNTIIHRKNGLSTYFRLSGFCRPCDNLLSLSTLLDWVFARLFRSSSNFP
jgi:hypothetical protein